MLYLERYKSSWPRGVGTGRLGVSHICDSTFGSSGTWDADGGASFQAFLLDKSHRWTGLPPPSAASFAGRDELEYEEVDRHRALGGRTFPDQVDSVVVDGKEEGDGLPAFGKGLLKYWKFDPDCQYSTFDFRPQKT